MPYPPRGWLELADDPANEDPAVPARFHLRRKCSRIENPERLVHSELPWSARHCALCAGDLDAIATIQRHEIPGRIVFVVGLAMILGCVALLIILGIGY